MLKPIADVNGFELQPILVKPSVARRLIGVGKTKWHSLVKRGAVEQVRVADQPMVVYASLLALAERPKSALAEPELQALHKDAA